MGHPYKSLERQHTLDTFVQIEGVAGSEASIEACRDRVRKELRDMAEVVYAQARAVDIYSFEGRDNFNARVDSVGVQLSIRLSQCSLQEESIPDLEGGSCSPREVADLLGIHILDSPEERKEEALAYVSKRRLEQSRREILEDMITIDMVLCSLITMMLVGGFTAEAYGGKLGAMVGVLAGIAQFVLYLPVKYWWHWRSERKTAQERSTSFQPAVLRYSLPDFEFINQLLQLVAFINKCKEELEREDIAFDQAVLAARKASIGISFMQQISHGLPLEEVAAQHGNHSLYYSTMMLASSTPGDEAKALPVGREK